MASDEQESGNHRRDYLHDDYFYRVYRVTGRLQWENLRGIPDGNRQDW
jgi:hypothetical protein